MFFVFFFWRIWLGFVQSQTVKLTRRASITDTLRTTILNAHCQVCSKFHDVKILNVFCNLKKGFSLMRSVPGFNFHFQFMMEKPDSIYRNFRTTYECIKKFLFFTSRGMQTHRKICVLWQNNLIFFYFILYLTEWRLCKKIE